MKQIKKTLAILMVVATSISFMSCNDDDNGGNVIVPEVKTNAKVVEIKTSAMGDQRDVTQQTGDFVKFSFKEGKVVTSDDWDFAVRGRLFLTNGRKYTTADQPNIFGATEPDRTKEVEVTTIIGTFDEVKDIGGFIASDWHKDYDYAPGSFDATAPAIAFESSTRSSSNSREAWHLRSAKNSNKLILRPVVFVFKTQDGHIAKMVIEKINRTNTDFDAKEDVVYNIKYYYNEDANSPSLDETK